jgi:oligopeptide transport system substrate-binding protein
LQKRLACLVLALVLIVGGIAGAERAAEQIVRFNIGAEPETLDPAKSTGVPEARIELNVFEGLTRLDENDMPQPAIAESWEISEDGLRYVFHLRKSQWSNGDPVTAHDFEYAWKRALAPETASQYAYQLFYIKNGEAYNAGEITDPSLVGVRAVDDYTLEVELEAPTAYFLSLAAFPTLMPVNRKVVEADPEGWFLKPETYVGNGPFKVTKWVHNSYLELEKNPLYWDADSVILDKLVATTIESEDTELVMFETGQLDITNTVSRPEIPRLEREGLLKVIPNLGTYYYIFNCEVEPLNDPRVRKALSMAIDREAITEYVTRAGEIPAFAFVPPGIPDAKPGEDFREVGGDLIEENVEKAKALLAEAGYPDGKGFPTLNILYNTMDMHKAIAEVIQEFWKKNLNIDVRLMNQEWGVYLNSRDEGDFEIARAGWIGDYVDPMTFMDMHVKDGGNNDSNWSDPEHDRLIQLAKSSNDPAVRMQAMHEAEAILMDQLPVMPIYYYVEAFLEKDYVKDVIYSSLGFIDFKYAWVAKH